MMNSEPVQALLALRPNHRMPLIQNGSLNIATPVPSATDLFPGSRSPEGARAGLMLYLGGWQQAHNISQDLETAEGTYWHAIVHRQEPDPGNAAYWFRHLGTHPIFADLHKDAQLIAAAHPEARLHLPAAWDPIAFVDICGSGSLAAQQVAQEIQHAEWQRLFDWCGQPLPSTSKNN